MQPALMWGAAACFDWIWFMITCLTILISCAAFGVIGLSTVTELGNQNLSFESFDFSNKPHTMIVFNINVYLNCFMCFYPTTFRKSISMLNGLRSSDVTSTILIFAHF